MRLMRFHSAGTKYLSGYTHWDIPALLNVPRCKTRINQCLLPRERTAEKKSNHGTFRFSFLCAFATHFAVVPEIRNSISFFGHDSRAIDAVSVLHVWHRGENIAASINHSVHIPWNISCDICSRSYSRCLFTACFYYIKKGAWSRISEAEQHKVEGKLLWKGHEIRLQKP